jgi:putative membrane protein
MRNGVMAALAEIPLPSMGELMIVGILAACAAYVITVRLSASAWRLNGFDSRTLNRTVIAFVVLLSIALTGPFGLCILLLAIAVGLVPHLVNIPRMYCMGAIMVPVMLYSFGFAWI